MYNDDHEGFQTISKFMHKRWKNRGERSESCGENEKDVERFLVIRC